MYGTFILYEYRHSRTCSRTLQGTVATTVVLVLILYAEGWMAREGLENHSSVVSLARLTVRTHCTVRVLLLVLYEYRYVYCWASYRYLSYTCTLPYLYLTCPTVTCIPVRRTCIQVYEYSVQ